MTIPVEETKSALKNALFDEDIKVIALVGDWGVGKSFLWNQIMAENRTQLTGMFPRYAYVSLFGKKDVGEVKADIFAKYVSASSGNDSGAQEREAATQPKRINMRWISSRKEKLFQLGQWVKSAASGIGGTLGRSVSEGIGGLVDILQYLAVKNLLICLDDLERATETLNPSQVLGLVNELVGERSCKVVLVLNLKSMSGPAKVEVDLYRERIIDKEITLDPPVEYACAAAIQNEKLRSLLHPHMAKLGVKNIRVIRKIKMAVHEIEARTEMKLGDRTPSVLASISLLTFCHLVRDARVPSVEQVLASDYVSLFQDAETRDKQSDVEKKLNDFLYENDWTNTDDCDRLLGQLVIRGSCNWHELKARLEEHSTEFETGQKRERFDALWEEWRSRFRNEAESKKFALNVRDTVTEVISIVSARQIDDVVWLLRQLQELSMAADLIDTWKNTHGNDPAALNLVDVEIFRRVRNDDLRNYCETRFKEISRAPKEIEEILSRIYEQRSWGGDDTRFLANATIEDYKKAFISTSNLGAVLHGWQLFARIGSPQPEDIIIKERGGAALREIAGESAANRILVEGLGVETAKVSGSTPY